MGLGELLFFGWALSKLKSDGRGPSSAKQPVPGMSGILVGSSVVLPNGFGTIGMACVFSGSVLGWTNVLPESNAKMRAVFRPGDVIVIKVGNDQYHAIRDGDGPQGGPFFRAV